MFTGIIEEIGKVEKVTPVSYGLHFRIAASRVLEDLAPDSSISVNGVCLTATKVGNSFFEATAVEETIKKSTLGKTVAGDKVNLERAMRLSDRMGGHIVQGHVDGIGKVLSFVVNGESRLLEIEIPEHLSKYTVEKGSIAVDGVSMTIAQLQGRRITISLIPHTLSHTILGSLHTGDSVNVEVDFIGKYVERFLQLKREPGKMNEAWLRSMGF